ADIRLRMADVMKDSEYDPLLTTPLYKAAFREYGIDIDALGAAEAARWITERAIRAELVEALEDWAVDLTGDLPRSAAPKLARVKQVPTDAARRKLLHAVAPLRQKILQIVAAADPTAGPMMRRLRQAVFLLDLDALRQLVASPAVESLPAATQFRVAIHLYVSGGSSDEVVALLRRAQRRHSADFWINHELGYQLTRLKPPQMEEALRFHTVA